MEQLLTFDNLICLLTLTGLEIVLGIDNIIFIAILVSKLDPGQQARARRIGMVLAMLMRIGLLLTISWMMKMTAPFFSVMSHPFSGRDLILLGGGLFLIGKATYEIHDKLEGETAHGRPAAAASFFWIIVQIVILDIVFSLDSVITAVGMAQEISIMMAAIVVAVIVMLCFAGAIGDFVNRHPTIKILALSFLILIGVLLVADGMGRHIEKGYAYFAMAFSLGVEMLNMRLRKPQAPVELRQTYVAG